MVDGQSRERPARDARDDGLFIGRDLIAPLRGACHWCDVFRGRRWYRLRGNSALPTAIESWAFGPGERGTIVATRSTNPRNAPHRVERCGAFIGTDADATVRGCHGYPLRVRESELLQHIESSTRDMRARWPQVVVGPGDDVAVVRADGAWLVTVDQVVEHRHFASGTSIDLIARKAVARSVSDIAAMGGSVRGGWGLATGVLPPRFAHAKELTEALHRWAERWGFPIVGGDIATGATGCPLMVTVTICGVPHVSRGPVLRSGAKEGDQVWVTGALGGSLESGRHLTFEPRLAEAAWLCDQLGDRLHAMIDLSDGLGRDAARIAAMSGVRIEIDGASVPRHEGVASIARAMGDGEDYELCFVTAPGVELPARVPVGAGSTPLTRIGRVGRGAGCAVNINGAARDAAEMGWDHV